MARRPWTPEEQTTAEVAAACGVSLSAIGRALGRDRSTVSWHLDPAERERRLESDQRWREANRERKRESDRRWRKANLERNLEAQRRWHEANRERVREKSRRWREANRKRVLEVHRRWREANRKGELEAQRRWRKANPERAREGDRRWRSRKRAANRAALVPVQGHHQLQQRFALFGSRCAYCGASERLTVDHVLALNAGGLDEPGNIAPACRGCNSGKRDRPVEAWYRSQPFFSETRWRKLRKHCPGIEAGQLPLSLSA